MPTEHPLLWGIITSASAAGLAMPLLKRVAIVFDITASRAGDSTPARVPTLGGPGIIAGFALGAGVLGMLPLWLVIGSVFLCLAGVIDDVMASRRPKKLQQSCLPPRP